MRQRTLLALIAAATVGVDQSTKWLAERALGQGGSIDLAGGFVHLEFALNRGGFLGMGSGLNPTLRWWLFTVGVGLALLLVLRLALSREQPTLQVVALALVLGGGVGNLIDRVLLSGAVRDFAVVGFSGLRTGIFNLGDTAILVGAGLLLVTGFRRSDPDLEAAQPSGEPE